ncbi:M20/M25/M40 family metallo-hydrolase [Gimesia aquarii]|uniref:Leupeptin-inactivating enzyme 1 n=1 Tax=Gimesia aquarii TaxID=2527964 RepID=A0A517WSU7_9PLAN|nr:M20/M25/M40 family metallo-hydrolase [Gimesia aquarii]QDU08325.1 Leupeptin-inactivating enzyme 1 precursor [Gimesia aquarii]
MYQKPKQPRTLTSDPANGVFRKCNSSQIKFLCLIGLVWFACGNHFIQAETNYPAASAYKAAVKSISVDELKTHIEFLASDSLEGREAGSQGGQAAGTYIRGLLQKYGIKPGLDDEGYFQEFQGGFRNIIGIIPGNDPELKKEYVVIGAHYDHVGYGKPSNSRGGVGQIHNGADDNASGTAALLEVIQALSKHKEVPGRSLMFVFWDAEEMGLLGSKYWVDHPNIPLDQISVYLNLDMVGRLNGKPLNLFGSRSSKGLRSFAVKCNHRETGVKIRFNNAVRPDSDHWPFYKRGIPFLMLHTGKHEDYHRPEDDAHKVDYAGAQKCAQLLAQLTLDFSLQKEKPKYRNADQDILEGIDQQAKVDKPDPPRLGVAWNAEKYKQGNLLVTQVLSNSPAKKAGLKIGDEIIKVDGKSPIRDSGFAALIRSAPSKIVMQVKRPKEEKPLEIPVELKGQPVRLGIEWKTDDSEPTVIVISNILKASSADLAGLQMNDRIYEIDGKTFGTSDEFRKLATTIPLPFTVLVEREGLLKEITIQSTR